MQRHSTEPITLQRSQLILHPAARGAFDLDQRIESEIAGGFVSEHYRLLAATGVFVVVVALQGAKNSGLYGFVANWHVLTIGKNDQVSCVRIISEIDDAGIAEMSGAYVTDRLTRMPRISTALAHCVELAKKYPSYLNALDISTARKNASAETAVANACRASKSTVRSQVRSLRTRQRRQMHQIAMNFEEIIS